jgi:hypothetical protein
VPIGVSKMGSAFRTNAVNPSTASHKYNLSSVPLGDVDSYSNLPWVQWEVATSLEVITSQGLPRHTLANRALVYPR